MKKKYIKPETNVIILKNRHPLLVGSPVRGLDGFGGKGVEEDYEEGD